MKINILGTEYELIGSTAKDHPLLGERNGYCDGTLKCIVYDNDTSEWDLGNKQYKLNQILRHEILHAFLIESGLDCCCYSEEPWARNEEMVDWFAIQSPKIFDVYKKLDIL